MNPTTKTLCILALLTATFFPARAGSPEYLNYQGLLNGADGQPLPTGNYTMEFNIYDSPTAGDKQWGPFLFDGGAGNGHGPLVPVANGRFNVIIGPLDTTLARSISTAFASSNRFIEIKVNGGSPILPRQQFLSTPYAFKANNADQAAVADLATVATSVSDVNVAYRNTTNTFTGNQTVNGTAIVNGGVTATGNVTAGGRTVAVGEENLRIVRGRVNGDGSIRKGSGFTVSRISAGNYRITFTPAFADEPTVTVTPELYRVFASTEGTTTTTQVQINFVSQSVGLEDTLFDFIAIGPR